MNNTEIYSTYNEGKSVVAERFVITLTAVSKIFFFFVFFFDVLDDIVNKYIT